MQVSLLGGHQGKEVKKGKKDATTGSYRTTPPPSPDSLAARTRFIHTLEGIFHPAALVKKAQPPGDHIYTAGLEPAPPPNEHRRGKPPCARFPGAIASSLDVWRGCEDPLYDLVHLKKSAHTTKNRTGKVEGKKPAGYQKGINTVISYVYQGSR